MRIALDTNPIYVTQAGVARYLLGLQRGFTELADTDLDISELCWPTTNFEYRQPMRAVRTAYRELIWPHTQARTQLRRMKPDLLHMTSGLNVRQMGALPRVITLYDLAIVRHPDRFRKWHASGVNRRLKRLHGMDRIICMSRFTADEAMQLAGIPANKLDVVHLAGQFSSDGSDHDERPSIDIPGEYFLFVGSLEPGKNLQLLKETYARAALSGHSLPPLVIVGARWQGVPGEGQPPRDWIYTGRLPDAQLLYLYRHALALVFPSRYEGFGLPPLEAMSQKCPVICSPVASLPEVVGDAACLAEQTPESYLEAMQRMSQCNDLREDLAERGQHQARQFSWRTCAEQTLSVYRMTLSHCRSSASTGTNRANTIQENKRQELGYN